MDSLGMKKLNIGLIAGSGALVSSLAGAVLFNGVAHGEWDLPGLNQQVQHVTEVTTNHEARINNLENKVNTPAGQPTPTPQIVTQVVTQAAPTAAPTVTPVSAVAPVTPIPAAAITVVSSKAVCDVKGSYTNYETMSDGTIQSYPAGRCNPSGGGTTITTNPITP
ncbi:MAG: hypothetical protein NVS3B3_07090 [Aquirhabdus sp.]